MKYDLSNESVGKLIKICSQIFDTYVNNSLKEINLTSSQINILIYIYLCYKEEISVNQIDIQNKFNLSNPTVSGILNRLEDKGFIKRINNGRSNRVIPTSEGILLIDNGYQRMNEIENKILMNFDNTLIEKLKELLMMIINNNTLGDGVDDKKISKVN